MSYVDSFRNNFIFLDMIYELMGEGIIGTTVSISGAEPFIMVIFTFISDIQICTEIIQGVPINTRIERQLKYRL